MTPFAAGLLTIAVVLIGTYFGFTKSVPFRHHYTIHAAFKTANNLAVNSPVRIAGVNVGKVTSIHHIADGGQGAIVDMRIDSNGLPIHRDAAMTIRPRIFLEGNFFVDLHPGSPSAPTIRDGDMIPVNQTAAPVQLDQVLSLLKTSTRADLQTLLKELSTGFSGYGAAAFNRSIQNWGPAYRTSSIVNDATLGTAQHDLSSYIASAGAVAQDSTADPTALQSLITNFNITAGALASQNVALANAIAELPRTLGVGRSALGALNAAFPAIRKLVAELDPATRSSLPTLKAGIPFLKQARKLVSKAEAQGFVNNTAKAVPPLISLNRGSVPLYHQVRQASSCQNSVILPWSLQNISDSKFAPAGPVYQEALKALAGTGGESREFDANGIWARVLLTAGNFAFPSANGQIQLSNFPIEGTNPVKPAAKPVFNETTPCETQQQPNLASTPSGPPPGQQNTAVPTNAKGWAMYNRSRTQLIKLARKWVKQAGLTSYLRVTNQNLPAGDIPHLKQLGSTFLGGRR